LVGSLAPAGRLPGEGSAHTLGGPQLLHQDQVPGAVPTLFPDFDETMSYTYFLSDISVKRLSHEIFDHSFCPDNGITCNNLVAFFRGTTSQGARIHGPDKYNAMSKSRPCEKSGQIATNCLRFGLAFHAKGTTNYGQH
jgi:hypothetical protein